MNIELASYLSLIGSGLAIAAFIGMTFVGIIFVRLLDGIEAYCARRAVVEEDEGDPFGAWNIWPAELKPSSRLAHSRVTVGSLASRWRIIFSCRVSAVNRVVAAATTGCWRLVDAVLGIALERFARTPRQQVEERA
jgi:hypothetical protein